LPNILLFSPLLAVEILAIFSREWLRSDIGGIVGSEWYYILEKVI
jgi:hypothetical protein